MQMNIYEPAEIVNLSIAPEKSVVQSITLGADSEKEAEAISRHKTDYSITTNTTADIVKQPEVDLALSEEQGVKTSADTNIEKTHEDHHIHANISGKMSCGFESAVSQKCLLCQPGGFAKNVAVLEEDLRAFETLKTQSPLGRANSKKECKDLPIPETNLLQNAYSDTDFENKHVNDGHDSDTNNTITIVLHSFPRNNSEKSQVDLPAYESPSLNVHCGSEFVETDKCHLYDPEGFIKFHNTFNEDISTFQKTDNETSSIIAKYDKTYDSRYYDQCENQNSSGKEKMCTVLLEWSPCYNSMNVHETDLHEHESSMFLKACPGTKLMESLYSDEVGKHYTASPYTNLMTLCNNNEDSMKTSKRIATHPDITLKQYNMKKKSSGLSLLFISVTFVTLLVFIFIYTFHMFSVRY